MVLVKEKAETNFRTDKDIYHAKQSSKQST